MTRIRAASAIGCLLLASIPLRALAFSDPEMFGEPAEAGGGAGRQFTGAPVDGLSCSVCHRGGTEPVVSIEGLPDTFEPGARYAVALRWEDDPDESHALQLELTSESGDHAKLELPDLKSLSRRSRCDGDDEGAPAVYSVEDEERSVLGVLDCGASELEFEFTAPDAPKLYFAAGIVRSDSSATADGDGVLEVRETLERSGASRENSGCSAAGGGEALTSPGHGLLLAMLGSWFLLYRSYRNSRPSEPVSSRAFT
jgi:hypothetical protein